jgi:hypothetical protein
MPMLRTCSAPGCKTLTLGQLCLEHETADVAVVIRHRSPALSAVRKPAARAAAPAPRAGQAEATEP